MRRYLLLLTLLLLAAPAVAQRETVLKQIDLPHNYYYREMYLPQLTTGPSSVTWAPDSRSVVYSMGGSLWHQALDSTAAEQLTDGPGYHYQPDWSPDGRWIVFAEYRNDAVELQCLEVATRKITALTSNRAVNVEPRWSPDGRRIAYVSTAYNGRFHIFAGEFAAGSFTATARLTGETRSPLPRYYYSAYDHEISPAWSPDGSELLFVSNRGHIYGTGGFWRMRAAPGAEPREIHYEETTWKARPDWSPDGKRVVYSSYHGRQWHQLWVTTAEPGGSPFALTYGEFDNTAPRWSPSGEWIAFVSNRAGNTSLWLLDALSGAQRELRVTQRTYRAPMGRLRVRVLDALGKPTPARVSVASADGRAWAPHDAWMHADDGFVRSERPWEAHYFHSRGTSTMDVPAGQVEVEVMKGFEHRLERRSVTIAAGQTAQVTIQLRAMPAPSLAPGAWVGGDVHIHMNYGGAYRNTPARFVQQAEAEDLQVLHNLVVNKEQRIPDIDYFRGRRSDPASTARTQVLHSQEFHTSDWGHMGLLGLRNNLIIPDYAGYPQTAAASLYPANDLIAELAHAQGALAGYVHPFDDVPDPAAPARLQHSLPVNAALGLVDYLEVVGFSDHRNTAEVWYRLLNCGFRIAAAGGTDAMANFASLHGPVGLNRTYVRLPAGPLRTESWLAGLRAGRTFASNGPLVDFSLGGKSIGEELRLPAASEVQFTAALASIVPLDHLQVVCNGEVVRELPLASDRMSGKAHGSVKLARSGWCVLRAWADKPTHPVLDFYPYATTSPVYVSVGDQPVRSAETAAYFAAWIARVIEAAKAHTGWNSDRERNAVLGRLEQARAVYLRMKD